MLCKVGITFRTKDICYNSVQLYIMQIAAMNILTEKLLHPILIISLEQILRTRVNRSKVMVFEAFGK